MASGLVTRAYDLWLKASFLWLQDYVVWLMVSGLCCMAYGF